MHYDAFLGADETKPAAPFWRLVNPTDLDKTALEMSRLIKSYYAGIDFLNIDLWRKLGLDVGSQGNPLQEFLQSYIQVSREARDKLTPQNKDWWAQTLHERFGIRTDDINDYLRAMLDMIRAGTMPESILKPYTYEPTEPGEDFTRSVFPRLVGAIAIIGGVLVLSNTLIPQVGASIGAARARRKK